MRNKRFVILFIDYLIMLTSFYLVISVFYGYITSQLKLTASFAGIVIGIFSFAAMIMRPFSGFLSERVNHRVLLRASIGCMILSGIIYWLCSQPALILFARILNGGSFALAGTIMIVEVYRSIPSENAGTAIGAFGLTNVIAASIGPMMATKMLDSVGYSGVFITSLALYLIMFFSIPRSEQIYENKKLPLTLHSFFAPKVVVYALMGGVFSFISAILSSYIVTFGKTLGDINLSLFFSINAIAVFIMRLVGGRIYDKKGMFFAGPPTMVVSALALFMLGFSDVISPNNPKLIIFISAFVIAIGQGVAWPALQTISLQSLDKSQSGAASGTYSLGADIGQMLGPIFAGVILGSYSGATGYFRLFSLTGVILIIATGLFTLYLYLKSHKQ